MIPITFLVLSPVGLSPLYQEVQRFYQSTEYLQPVTAQETCIIAQTTNTIAGCCRLVEEEEILLLRGMQVAKELRGQGIGSQMLSPIRKAIGQQPCYCIPYNDLEPFYGSIGFQKIDPAQASLFLQERLKFYKQAGLSCIIMKKDS